MPQQITIKSIAITGFKSYSDPVTFQFANTGLHLIRGNNGNGKTSLFSALVWCLYKVNLNNTANSKIPTWKWKRTEAFKGTRVQVVLGIGRHKYLIARHIAYTGTTKGITGEDSLLIFRKDKSDKTPITAEDIVNDELYKKDQQAYLIRLLGIDSKTFLNSILFGQRMARLMESKDADKRDLFEKLFDASFIDVLKDRANVKVGEVTSALTAIQTELTLSKQKHELLTNQLANANTILEEFNNARKVALANIRRQHELIRIEVEDTIALVAKSQEKIAKAGAPADLTALAIEMDSKRESYYDAKDRLSMLKMDVTSKQRDIKVYTDKEGALLEQLKNVTDKCPVCNGKLSEVKVIATRNKLKEEINDNKDIIKALENNLKVLQTAFESQKRLFESCDHDFVEASEAYEEAKNNNATVTYTNELLALQQKHRLLIADAKRISAQHKYEKDRQPPTVNIDKLQGQLDELTENLPKLEVAATKKSNLVIRLNWWIKSAFNSGGLRSYIFSASLNHLNTCIAKYSQYFGISVVFGIDLAKANKPFYCKVSMDAANEVDYDELSGGEKQKVDLVMIFGLQDASEVKTSFNLNILDEPEGNLDSEVLEVFDTLLRLRAEKKAIYVISHNNQMDLSSATLYTISGGKNGTSVIE